MVYTWQKGIQGWEFSWAMAGWEAIIPYQQQSRGREYSNSGRELIMVSILGCSPYPPPPSSKTSLLPSPSIVFLGSYSSFVPAAATRRRRRKHLAASLNFLLIKAQVNFVNAEDATQLVVSQGYTVLDVRDKTQYERAHIKQSKHVPLFIENNDNDPGTIIKRQLHNNFSGLFYGLPFTKPNPEFLQSVKAHFSPDAKLLVVCQEGLRSASASEKLDASGFKNVACMTSGLQSVKPGSFETVGSTELQNAGKAGLVMVQGKISAVLGTLLICAYLFITFFPDQAEKIIALFPSS